MEEGSFMRHLWKAGAIALIALLCGAPFAGPSRAQSNALRWIRPTTGQALTVDPSTQRLFIMAADGSVTTLQALTGAVLNQVTVPGAGTWGASVVDSSLGRAVLLRATGAGGSQVVLLDTRTGAVLQTTTTPSTATALAEDTRTQRVYVAQDDASGTVSVLDARVGQTLDSLQIGAPVEQVAVDASAHRLFAISAAGVSGGKGTLHEVDLATGVAVGAIQVGRGPHALGVDEATGRVLVTNAADRTISVVDAGALRVLATTVATLAPGAVMVDATHGRAYVLDAGSGQPTGGVTSARTLAATVDVLDTRTGAATLRIPVGVPATALAIDPRTGNLFVATGYAVPVNAATAHPNTVVGALRIISMGDRPLLRTVPMPAATVPAALAMDAPDGRLYVLVNGSTTTISGTVAGFSAMLDESRL
jgi:DNA-binding beta-propeller fold protein YncE